MNTEMFPVFPGEYLIKSAAVIAVACLFAGVARGFPPARKHTWLLVAFGLTLSIPVLFLFPEWKVLPAVERADGPGPEPSAPVETGTPISSGVDVPGGSASRVDSSWSPAEVLVAVWGVGCGVLLLRFLVGWIFLRRLDRTWSPPCQKLRACLAMSCRKQNFRRTVRLVISPKVTAPFTWGVFRPRIVLPISAVDWSDGDLEMILLHELEHIRRYDALAVVVSQVFVACHWVNPLAWFANRQACRFREHACDDAVLKYGYARESYADLLYRHARAASRSFLSPGAAAVVENHTVERRIQALLKGDENGSPVHRPVLSRVVTAVLVVTALCAGIAGSRDSGDEDAAASEGSIDASASSEESGDAGVSLERHLAKTILPLVEFNGFPFPDALDYLESKINETYAFKNGGRVVIFDSNEFSKADVKIHLRLTDVPIGEALRYTVSLARSEYTITPDGNIKVATKPESEELLTSVFVVKRNFLSVNRDDGADAVAILKKKGIAFPAGTSAIYDPEKSRIIVRNTEGQMDRIARWLEAEKLGAGSDGPVGDPASVRVPGKNPDLEAMENKLRRIILPEVEFRDLPLADALGFLQQRSVELDVTTDDPNKKGINIILEADGLEEAVLDAKITLKLSSVPLAEGLRYTTALAGLEYVVEPHAVVIRKGGE